VKASELRRTRIVLSESTFAELVLWRLAQPLEGCRHPYEYRLACVVDSQCVLRYDNESGKGGHRHAGSRESRYEFSSVEKLVADFMNDIARLRRENRGP
jgi:hypothetical protein